MFEVLHIINLNLGLKQIFVCKPEIFWTDNILLILKQKNLSDVNNVTVYINKLNTHKSKQLNYSIIDEVSIH